jgi:hypothetical protein
MGEPKVFRFEQKGFLAIAPYCGPKPSPLSLRVPVEQICTRGFLSTNPRVGKVLATPPGDFRHLVLFKKGLDAISTQDQRA